MQTQTTDSVLMVRPAAFHANPGTMASNPFQDPGSVDLGALQRAASLEFDGLVRTLRGAGVRVLVLQDDLEFATPDSIFPNNWFSTHADGRLVLYPMLELSRRAERRLDLLRPLLLGAGFAIGTVELDLIECFEEQGQFLEGTGSMVLDRENRIAYANRSARTHAQVLQAFCEAHDYAPRLFDALDANGQAYYHTNVIMALGRDFAVLCLEAVPQAQRSELLAALEASGRRLVAITREQALSFAGNQMELHNAAGARLVVLSASALACLDQAQREAISLGGTRLLSAPIPNIERYGGGSVRCMIAEIFLPRA